MTASFTEMPSEWGRPEWLEWRRAGCGGSDVAAICGLSTFGSPTSVYWDKVGVAPEQPESESMQWGRLLEGPIALEFTARTDLHVVVPQLLVHDVEQPWRRATLDGLVVESIAEWEADRVPARDLVLGSIQIKTTRDAVWTEDHGGIPDRVALQCQWEMGIATLEHCWLTVLHGGQRLEVYEVEFDELVYKRLCTIVDRFWAEHVLAGNPPPADSNPATTQTLKDVFGDRADGSTVTLDDETVLFVEQWLPAKAALKEAEAVVEQIENRLRGALGESVVGSTVIDGEGLVELVTWKPQNKARHLDWKALRAEHPDIYEQYLSEPGVTRVLRATKALKALAEVDA